MRHINALATCRVLRRHAHVHAALAASAPPPLTDGLGGRPGMRRRAAPQMAVDNTAETDPHCACVHACMNPRPSHGKRGHVRDGHASMHSEAALACHTADQELFCPTGVPVTATPVIPLCAPIRVRHVATRQAAWTMCMANTWVQGLRSLQTNAPAFGRLHNRCAGFTHPQLHMHTHTQQHNDALSVSCPKLPNPLHGAKPLHVGCVRRDVIRCSAACKALFSSGPAGTVHMRTGSVCTVQVHVWPARCRSLHQ